MARKRRYKFNAKKTELDGITFDSKAEAKRYSELKLLKRAGEIEALSLQPRFVLQEGYISGEGKRVRPITYIADFAYIDKKTGKTIVEDVKGMRTSVYKLKKKLFEKTHYPLTIKEIEV